MKRLIFLLSLTFVFFLAACADTTPEAPVTPAPDAAESAPESDAEASNGSTPSTDGDTEAQDDDLTDGEFTPPSEDDPISEETTTEDDDDATEDTPPSEDDPSSDQTATEDDDESDMVFLTLEQLSEFDGRNGNPAYIAVNGVIYDVTNSPRWRNGNHNGYQAGQDLTEAIMSVSPHGQRVLDNIPKIGYLVEE